MPRPRSRHAAPQSHAAAYTVLGVLLVFATTAWVRDARDRVDEILHGDQFVRDPFDLNPEHFAIEAPRPEAEAAGVRPDDRLLAVDGSPMSGLFTYYGRLRDARHGERTNVRVQGSDGSTREVSIELQPFSYLGFRQDDTLGYFSGTILTMVMPLFCLTLGFWVVAVRPRDLAAWLLLGVMLGYANGVSSTRTTFGTPGLLQPYLTAFSTLCSNLTAPALAFLGLTFPTRTGLDRRFPWLKWVVFSPLFAFAIFASILLGYSLHDAGVAASLWAVFHAMSPAVTVAGTLAFLTFFVSLVVSTLKSTDPDERRRLLLLGVGAATPLGLVLLVSATVGVQFSGWTAILQIIAMFLVPLTMAYVIVVERALDVRVVIRMGLQYILASNGVRILHVLVSVAITVVVAVVGEDISVTGRVLIIAAGLALLAGLSRLAQRLHRWIDKRFFRDRYEADALLTELAGSLRTLVGVDRLLEIVAQRVSEALHVPRIAILLAEGGVLVPAYLHGYVQTPSVTLTTDNVAPLLAEGPTPVSDGTPEQPVFDDLGAELLVPLSFQERLLGVMCLGAKLSEEPFSRGDTHLLSSVASQVGIGLENARLAEAMKAEAAAVEKHRRELEIAHSVQERLFPQSGVTLEGVHCAGHCRPALGVGGDYYDFIPLSPARVGIAIGDVSGKGIPAALLMATLRAYLRGQTIQQGLGVESTITNLNRLLFESSPSNRYATLFYAELDREARTLTYCNAGHNPPILLRRHSQPCVERLATGGSVVGLFEDCSYQQATVTLQPGDRLIGFTDGISEAMNARDEEWGEERLIEAAGTALGVPGDELILRLMAAADAFVNGAPQHDDMTLVVVELTGTKGLSPG